METDQEIYDTVVAHLRKQGRPARSLNGVCMYRAERGKRVLMCAVGCLIPDSEYHKKMEGHDVHGLLLDMLLAHNTTYELIDTHTGLLSSLQAAHDECEQTKRGLFKKRNLESALKRVAYLHNLEYRKPT